MKALFKSNMEGVSYPELSSWASTAIIGTMLLFYFNKLIALGDSTTLTSDIHNQLLFLVVVVTVVTEIIFQILVAAIKMFDANGDLDERDKLMQQQATQISSHFIFGFLAILILAVSQSDLLIEELSLYFSGLEPKDILLSVLVVGFGLAQFLHHLSLAIFYRRGS